MFSRSVENTEEIGEIAHYVQFLHFPQCFQKTLTYILKPGLVRERAHRYIKPIFTQVIHVYIWLILLYNLWLNPFAFYLFCICEFYRNVM